MSLECGGEKGWMRIANINATGGDNCPRGWRKITSPTRACRASSDNAGCYSAHFTTYNIPYSRVCGMVVGYQNRMHFAFVLQLTTSMQHSCILYCLGKNPIL